MRKGERYNIHYINRDYIYITITQQKKREGERDTKQLGKKGCIFFFFSRPGNKKWEGEGAAQSC